MSRKIPIRFVLALALLVPSRGLATDYYVRISGNDGNPGTSAAASWRTIQHALDTMVAGDTATIGAGTYNEAIRSIRNGTLGAPIALVADATGTQTGDAGTVTITRAGIDVVSMDHDHHLLRGFRISGGYDGIEASGASGLVLEDVVAVSNGDDGIDLEKTEATLVSCTISGAQATGLELTESSVVSVSGATFITRSGGDGIFAADAKLSVTGSTIEANSSEGLRCERARVVIENAVISGNRADGIECFTADVAVSNSAISNNLAEGIQVETAGSLVVTGSKIVGNRETGILVDHVVVELRDSTVSSSGREGIAIADVPKGAIRQVEITGSGYQGIEVFRSNLDLVGVRIQKSGDDGLLVSGTGVVNMFDSSIESSGDDGVDVLARARVSLTGVRIEGSADDGAQFFSAVGRIYETQVLASGDNGVYFNDGGEGSLVNSIVAGSGRVGVFVGDSVQVNLWHVVVADSGSDGVFLKEAKVFLTNSIVARNGGHGLEKSSDSGSLRHDHNLYWKNRGGDLRGTAPGTGELFADPAFASASDFHLAAASPAIDTGADASATTTKDLDGNSRPEGAAYDIGAYELVVGSAIDHFALGHDGHGVYCLGETIKVAALDASNSVVDDFTGAITLDTQTGNGTWAAAVTNQGSFSDSTPDDGIATYTFADADDGAVAFTLTYLQGGTPLDVDAFETANAALRDDDAEGTMAWLPSGFVVTANALPSPPPAVINDPVPTQTAGSVFPLHITAYGQTPTDPTCGVIESYTGPRPVSFWGRHLDPGTGSLLPTIDGTAIGSSQASASPQTVLFANGQAVVSANYKDVGRIQIDLVDLSVTEPPGGIPGATTAFVVRPAELEIAAIRRPDGTSNPAVSIPTGTVFVAAGSPFEVDVRVLDAEGSLTPNFGREASPEGLAIQASTLVAPAGGRNGTTGTGAILNGSSFSAIAPAGTFRGSSFGWDEVGAIRLEARVTDGSYLGTGASIGTESGTVGRFTPASFDVALNAPSFETSCVLGSFGYVGQEVPFAAGLEPEVTATALNAQGTTTENYSGSWFRLDAASQTGLAFLASSGTLSAAAPNPPSVSPLGAGVGRLRFDNGPDVGFQRTAPIAPFDAEIVLRFDLLDQDGVAPTSSNPVQFGQAAPSLGIPFTAGKSQRFGRMVITNAHGSELSALGVPFGSEYWNGSAFVTHTDDVCTTAATAWLGLTPQPGSLATAPTIANSPLLAGDAGLELSSPGVGQTGHVDLLFDLTTGTGADLPWLLGDWNGDGGWLESPTGRATFGIFSGEGRTIYVRDAY